MNSPYRNVGLLAVCQALLLTNNVILIAINGLAGFALAPTKALATLPVTGYVVGAALTTMPASLFMKRVGRRRGFITGSAFGMLGAGICSAAVYAGSFWLLCAGTLVAGVYNAFGQYYRFAAADAATPEFRSRAISLTLAGGIVGGVIGPETSKFTQALAGTPFLGTYVSLMAFAVISMLVASAVRVPPAPEHERAEGGRPLAEIARQPVFVVAVLGAMVGYAVMNLLMTATPLAMSHNHHPYSDAAFVLEWHVIGMFAPSFFTGSLIRRVGVLQVMLAGAALLLACVAIAASGVGLTHFWSALVLLGVGWNFLYVGGTTLLTECYSPAEKARAQGANEFLVFFGMALSSAASGALVTSAGWHALNLWALPFVLLAAAAIVWLMLRRRRQAQPA